MESKTESVNLENADKKIIVTDEYIDSLIEDAIMRKHKSYDSVLNPRVFLDVNYRNERDEPNAILLINSDIYNEWIKHLNQHIIKSYHTFIGIFEIVKDDKVEKIELKFYNEL